MKRTISIILAILMVLSVFAGCASDKPTTSETVTADGFQPRAGKIVNVGLSENLISLDPLDQANIIGNMQNNLIYEPMVWYDGVGGFEPCLAESWEYNEDGTVWTFHLRQGVKFHNGEAFDANDVACTFQRIMDNIDALNNPLQYWPALESFRIVDQYTFEFTLSEPYATVLLSTYFTPIIPDEAYAELGDKLWLEQNCYGTGPWIFDEWIDGQYCHYLKNEDYWDKENYDSYYDELYLRYITEPSSLVANHIAGDIQVNCSSSGINPDMLALYTGTENTIDLLTMASGVHHYIGFSFKEGSPFNDPDVRKAFNSAIDRQAIVDNIMGGGKVPNSIIMSTDLGYNSEIDGYTYDPELAKELLANSSYNGETIELACNVSALKGEAVLLAISDMLNSVGFNTTVSVVEVATLSDMRKTGEYDTFMVANMHAANDPGNTLTFRILNDGHHGFYEDEELFELIRQSNAEVDPDKRTALIQEIASVMDVNNAPHTAICQMDITYAADKGVTDLELYSDGWMNLKHINFDPSAE